MNGQVQAPRISGLLARAVWRKAQRRLRAGPAWRWRYSGRTPERILIAPPDLRVADPQIAQDIYFGRFPLASQLVECRGCSPFELEVSNHAWVEALQGFRWLRHLHAAQTELAAGNARALVNDWILIHGRSISGEAWAPGATGARIIAWLQHSSIILQGADLRFYRQFLRSLSLQLRYLRSIAPTMVPGEERLRARIAIALACLSLPSSAAALRHASRCLGEEIELQILADGGHVSRNPAAVLELLVDMLPLRQTYTNQGEQPPAALVHAIDRMIPALRFFRHRDGSLARFNGMGVTVHDRVASVLRHDDTDGASLLHAPHSGYDRLALDATIVIADTGRPPVFDLSGEAHAGCLSFELSSGKRPIIVNSGIDRFGEPEFRPLARATAAHSTATINDVSSARFSLPPSIRKLIGTPLVAGPQHVTSIRNDRAGVHSFTASHDGFAARFGLLHERMLELSENGSRLVGRDRFLSAPAGKISVDTAEGGKALVTLRFHIHPDNDVLRDPDGNLVIVARDGDSWTFLCDESEALLEESIYFAGITGPQRSRQIVLNFDVGLQHEINWQLQRHQYPVQV